MSESFERVLEEARPILMDECVFVRKCDEGSNCTECGRNVADRLKTAHEHELEHVRKSRFHDGYVAGQHSMDAEHYAVALRLRALPLDGDTQENLAQIARAVWHSDFGWTQGACKALRDELVRLMGGVTYQSPLVNCGNPYGPGDAVLDAGIITPYDVLGNERHEAVCRLREWEPDEDGMPHRELWEAVMGEKLPTVPLKGDAELDIIMRDRLIHLLGGDEPTAMEYIQRIVREHDRKCLDMELSGAELSQASVEAMSRRADQSHESSPAGQENETGITAEFRECVETASKSHDHCISEAELLEIADRIDEEAEHNEQKIEVLMVERQSIRDELKKMQSERDSIKRAAERDADHLECITNALNDAERERDELQEKLDELESFDPEVSIAAFGDDNNKLRRMLSRAAALLANAEQDRDANYANWMDCKAKVVQANTTIDELQAKLEEAEFAIANWREREKSFDASERLREELRQERDYWKSVAKNNVEHLNVINAETISDLKKVTGERDELRERLDRVAAALRGVERGTMSAWEAEESVRGS